MYLGQPGIGENSFHAFVSPSPWAKEVLIYPISIGHFCCGEGYYVNRTIYNSYLLLKVLSGDLIVKQNHQSHTVKPGQILLLDCYQPHAYNPASAVEFVFAHIDGQTVGSIYKAIEKRNGAVITASESSVVESGLRYMIEVLRQSKRIPEEKASSMLYGMLMELLEYTCPGNTRQKQPFPMKEVTEYIESRLDKPISLEELSILSGYSVFHFSRLFKRHIGMSPYQYIVISRLDRAKYLLHTTDLKIQTISQMVGFGSEANFSYAFEKHVHMPPSQFRKSGL